MTDQVGEGICKRMGFDIADFISLKKSRKKYEKFENNL